MSRRAKPTFTNQHFRDVKVVCTRRGTHKPKRLGAISVHRSLDFEANPADYSRLRVESYWNEDRARQLFEFPNPEGLAASHHATYTDPLECSRCNLKTPVRRDRLDGVVQTLVRNGLWSLDISYLPDMLK